jgi:amino acid permease
MEYQQVPETESIEPLEQGSTSAFKSILILSKATVGAGIIALPQKARHSGVPLFVLLICVAGFFTIRSVEMIAKGARATRKFVFEEITEQLLGPRMSFVVGLSMLLNCFGASIVYMIAIKDALDSLLVNVSFGYGIDLPSYVTMIIGGVLSLCTLIPDVSSVSVISVIGVIGVLVTVIAVVYARIHLGEAENLSEPPAFSTLDTIIMPAKGLLYNVSVISTITFSLCNQFNVPQVYRELRDKRSENVGLVAFFATLLPAVLYIITAIAGYLCYGSQIEENIFKNFAPLVAAKNVWIMLGILALIVSVIGCHILNGFPLKLSVIYFLPVSAQENFFVKYILPILLSLCGVVIALIYSEVSMFIGLLGAATGGIICYITPALLSMKADILDAEKPYMQRVKISNYVFETFMVIVGVFLCVLGTACEIYFVSSKETRED